MNHCHISLCCNELPFLKQKLPFLYKYFSQIIIIDYDIKLGINSTDGSIDYIKNFNDPLNKITLIDNFDPNKIKKYFGVSMVEKQKMFSCMSSYIKDDIDLVWATDMDEFFDEKLINNVIKLYAEDNDLISIDVPHICFCYNQFNIFNLGLFYIKPRITRHKKGQIYGHCNFDTYGKTLKIKTDFLYHFSYVGFKRCQHKLFLFNNKTKSKHMEHEWLNSYLKHLKDNDKYVKLIHPGSKKACSKYNGNYPEYIDIENMINELNYITD